MREEWPNLAESQTCVIFPMIYRLFQHFIRGINWRFDSRNIFDSWIEKVNYFLWIDQMYHKKIFLALRHDSYFFYTRFQSARCSPDHHNCLRRKFPLSHIRLSATSSLHTSHMGHHVPGLSLNAPPLEKPIPEALYCHL